MKTPTMTDRVRAYLAEHPEAGHTEIARALGISYAQAKDCRGRIPKRPPEPRASLPTFMVAGPGDREDGCARYEECLSGAAVLHPKAAHCPRGGKRYKDRDHWIDRAIASSVARESTAGGLGEAPMWASGGEW